MSSHSVETVIRSAPARRAWLVLALAALVVAGAALVGGRGDETPPAMEDRVQAIAAGLRCPVCQNLSVADSPSRLAREMRAEIEAQARAGRTDEQIRAYFVARYGEWVLLEPTRRGLNLLPWLVPVAGLLGGAAVWAFLARRRPSTEGAPASEADRRRIERELGAAEDPA